VVKATRFPSGDQIGELLRCSNVKRVSLMTLVYLPSPKFLIAPNLIGSVFWLFAVIGAIRADRTIPVARPIRSLTQADLIVTAAALLMVRFLVHGVRLTP
jgi:hypothetical protein